MASDEQDRVVEALTLLQGVLTRNGMTFGDIEEIASGSPEADPNAGISQMPTSDDTDRTLSSSLGAAIRQMYRKSDTEPGGLPKSFHRYTDLELIEKGGMGQVYRATDPEIGRSLAIKTLRPGRDGDRRAIDRFRREVQITGQLEHPNIVPIYDLGRSSDGTHFFCMKLVSGEPLSSVLQNLERTTAAEGTRYEGSRFVPDFLKICDAIEFAHARKIVHRDLKPANLMVGRFGEILVVDWGLAKRLEEEAEPDPLDAPSEIESVATREQEVQITQEGAVLGTPLYMPPEQAAGEGEKVDERSDIYALGAILYEMLTLPTYPRTRFLWSRSRLAFASR